MRHDELARFQAEADRLLEDVKLNRTRNIYYLHCAACLHQIDLADFIETGKARCPKCNQLNQTDVNSIRFEVTS